MRWKKRNRELADAIELRKRVNASLLERVRAKVDELRETKEQGHGLEDLAEPVPHREEDGEQ